MARSIQPDPGRRLPARPEAPRTRTDFLGDPFFAFRAQAANLSARRLIALTPLRYPGLCRPCLAVAGVFLAIAAWGQAIPELPENLPLSSADRFIDLFRPARTDFAALSPDGKYLAYSLRENGKLSVLVVEAGDTEKAVSKKIVETDAGATGAMTDDREETPARIHWMGWPSPTRLVFETNRSFSYSRGESWRNTAGAILAFDADGTNGRVLTTPFDVAKTGFDLPGSGDSRRAPLGTGLASARSAAAGERAADLAGDSFELRSPLTSFDGIDDSPRTPRVVGFFPGDGDSLYIRGEDTRAGSFGTYKLNVRTGRLSPLAEDVVEPGRLPLFDREGRVRVAIDGTVDRRFPHACLYDANRGLNRWREIDKIVKLEGAPDFWVSPHNFFGARSMPVAFDEDPDVVYFASNVGRDTYGIYGLNIKTGVRTGPALQSPVFDLVAPTSTGYPAEGSLVFDRYAHTLAGVRFEGVRRTARWLLPELQTTQVTLEASLPGRGIEILDWDEARGRFLAFAQGPSDPGAFYIYDRGGKKLVEFARASPWIDEQHCHPAADFSFLSPDGGRVTGIVTMPQNSPRRKIPVLVVCPASPWERVGSDFHPGTQAFARMGYAVVELNSRRAWGFGLKQRAPAQSSYEEVLAADILTALGELAQYTPIDLRHVALFGERHGGYAALRVLQLKPARFRCAISLDAPVDLQTWLGDIDRTSRRSWPALVFGQLAAAEQQQGRPLISGSETLLKPVFLLADPGDDADSESERGLRSQSFVHAKSLAASLRTRGIPAEFVELPGEYIRGLPKARAAVYAQIEDFLNLYVYRYTVNLGVEEVVEGDVDEARK